MDSVFLLGDGERAAFLQHMMRSFGCLHVCLWSHLPQPSNCLLALDGLYRETRTQNPSSSSGSLARRLFDAYRESVSYVDTGRIPGFAFKNNLPYMELKLHDLQRMASHDVQLQYYKEAGIKTVVFMGCAAGEIELGISSDHPQVDLEKEMKNLFPVDFSRTTAVSGGGDIPPSSSSSSLRSLSADSSEYSYSPLLFSINPTTTTEPNLLEDTLIRSVPLSTPPTITAEIEDAAMTRAMLAVLTSPSTNYSSSSSNSLTAFGRYSRQTALAPVPDARRKQNMFKRSVLFFRNLNMMRRQHSQGAAVQGGNRPTTTQMHHMISERRRREKLNESFQVLRTLLPSGTKKDKASLLSSTTEYLSSLKSQVAELSKRNQTLEMQLIMAQRSSRSSREDDRAVGGFSSVGQRTNVEIVPVSSSTSEATRFLDMRVRVRSQGESNYGMMDLVVRILDLLKQHRNVVSLTSVESNTAMSESSIPVHEITMRLKIEDEFDESTLGLAVIRLLDDQPK